MPPRKRKPAPKTLFDEIDALDPRAPLAARMRAQSLDEFVGQEILVGHGRPLRRAIEADALPSCVLWGPSGSGKTTLVNLLARFYQPSSGKITINETNIDEFELISFRSNIAFVDQHVRLFNDTIKGNIAFGQKDSMPLESITHAAKISNSAEFIEKLENQFDTEIGEDGITLSGGQRQRLSIARAIAKDSPILILDEATSALDSATERLVQSAINKMQQDRTTIIIAHRLSTIKNADRIIFLKEGEIVEQGSHKELINASGEYAKLNQAQSK